MNENKKFVFDQNEGKFNNKSTRYQTKRSQEKTENFERMKKEFIDLQHKLLNKDSYLDEQVKIYEKRFKTLRRYFSINKKEEVELSIPFSLNQKTVVYIRERNCFKDKWVNLLGLERIERTIKLYKELLPFNTNNTLYWNPF